MKSRFLTFGLAIVSVSLVACGGGGGGGTTPPAPTAPPPLGLAYTGTITKTDTYTYPAASPLPPTTASATVSQSISIGNAAAPVISPAPTETLQDVHSIASATGALTSSTLTTDTWVGASSTALLEFASLTNDGTSPTPNTVETVYPAGIQIDAVPEAAGTWTNSPASTVTEHDADGTGDVRTVASDGTYADTQTDPLGLTLVIGTNADGSGSYTGTFFSTVYGITGVTMGAPSGGNIAINVETLSSTFSPLANPPAWFASPLTPYKETDALTTGVTFPAGCKVPSQFGTTGNHIAQAIDSVDQVLGYTEHKTIDTYTSSQYGPVCVQMGDTQTYYYDYLNDTQQAIYSLADWAGTVQHVATLNETLTLQSETGSGATVFAKSRANASQAAGVGRVLASQTTFASLLQREREERIAQFRAYVKAHANLFRGGAK